MAIVKITNIYTNKVESFSGESATVAHDVVMAHPWLHEYGVRLTDLADVLSELEKNQALLVEVEQDSGLHKSDGGIPVAKLMLGHDENQAQLFSAAEWLSGFKPRLSEPEVRSIMLRYDGEPESVALAAYGMEPNKENLQALRAVCEMGEFSKSEEAITTPQSIIPGTDTAKEVALAVKRAFEDHQVEEVHLGGKHTKGSMVANDDGDKYLLKMGSGGLSPAAGVQDEVASQARREAAFYHVAKTWGMGEFFPPAEFVVMDGHDWAVIDLLNYSYKNLETIRKEDPSRLYQAMEHYRLRGIIHRWAALEFTLGNPDSHCANLMISQDNKIKLIDHGSAFAGPNFNPGHDDSSFVPFYLRYLAGSNFHEMDEEHKLNSMPAMSQAHDFVLQKWIEELDGNTLAFILTKFGISPDASVERLSRVKQFKGPAFAHINQLWIAGSNL